MGMYTEILIKCDIDESRLSETDLKILDYLFNGKEEPEVLPDNEFFKCSRWRLIGSCSSYYHIPWSDSKYDKGYLFSRSDIKNYSGEISLFFDWIRPLLGQVEGDCIGYSWYEENQAPDLVYM